MKLFWSDVAEADLDNIYDHIARDVLYYAELFIDRLVEATNKLQDHPRIGRQVPEAGYRDDVREIILQGYRTIYRITADGIYILTVIHGSQDLARRSSVPWEDN